MYDRKVRRNIRENNMLQKGDRIMAAVSGGKDSMSMLWQLWKKNFDITAVIVNEGTKYRTECSKIAGKFCNEYSIPFIIKSFKEEYGTTMDKIARKKTPLKTCSYCGVLRRNILNKAARELGVDKVATGHNLDDEAQTILMNLYRSEMKRLARCGPVVGVMNSKHFIPRIKPLRECLGKENIIHALLRGIEFETLGCPHRGTAYRNIVREHLNEMEHYHPGTKIGLLHNFDRLLPHLKTAFKENLNLCKNCGEVSSGEICKTCQMIQELKSS